MKNKEINLTLLIMAIILAIVAYCLIFADFNDYEVFALISIAGAMEFFAVGVLIVEIMKSIKSKIDY